MFSRTTFEFELNCPTLKRLGGLCPAVLPPPPPRPARPCMTYCMVVSEIQLPWWSNIILKKNGYMGLVYVTRFDVLY